MLHNINTGEAGPRGEAMADAIGTCVHCGFCLPACPTYQELGSEMDSPRGRILLMKSVLEGELTFEEAEQHIDRCLGCVACVTHCPSGVEYGDLISSFRDRAREQGKKPKQLRDWLAMQTLPYAGRFRWAMRAAKWTGFIHRLMPPSLRPMLELVPDELPPRRDLPEVIPAEGTRKGRVAMLAGCAQQVLAPDINAASARVLSRNGIEVVIPKGQGCCGALAWHSGEGKTAQRFAEALMKTIPGDIDCFVTTAAGCGSAIAEYPLLMKGTGLEEQAIELTKKTMDVSVYLSELDLAPIPQVASPIKIAYHDACHLAHAQKVRRQPRELLAAIPGVEVAELADPDTCCGSAGTYNIEQPEIAASLGSRKAADVTETGAAMVATGNIGCLVQIENHLKKGSSRVPVLHTMQVLDLAYQSKLR